MALDYSNFGGVTDNGQTNYAPLASLSQMQSGQAWDIGTQAAKYADPFMNERAQYQKKLSDLISNPGSLETSPYYQYLKDTAMNAVNSNNAARGFSNSGRGLMALQDRAQQVASQAYFPQVQALSSLAMSGSSPLSAGASFAAGANRSQDLAQMAAAGRAFQPSPKPPAPSIPTPPDLGSSTSRYSGGYGSSTGLPSGGFDTAKAAKVLTEIYNPTGDPSSQAGTGYISGDFGTTTFGNPQDYTTSLYGDPFGSNYSSPYQPTDWSQYTSSDPLSLYQPTDWSQYSQPVDYGFSGYDPNSSYLGDSGYAIDPYNYDQNYG